MFSVSGTNRLGLSAAVEDADFFVDTQPPKFANIQYPVAIQKGNVVVSFQVGDGPDGSGIAEVKCR